MPSHLTEKLAEYVWGELSVSEMAAADAHLMQCADCRAQVEQFQHTHAFLKSSADVEPPRRIIFEADRPAFVPWIWRWLAPMAASAAVALAVVSLVPRPEPQIIERVVVQQAPSIPASPPAVQPVDYEKIIDELRADMQKRDIAQTKELQRVRGELDWLDSKQRAARRDNFEMLASIEPRLNAEPR
jgi:hypothetical protein